MENKDILLSEEAVNNTINEVLSNPSYTEQEKMCGLLMSLLMPDFTKPLAERITNSIETIRDVKAVSDSLTEEEKKLNC